MSYLVNQYTEQIQYNCYYFSHVAWGSDEVRNISSIFFLMFRPPHFYQLVVRCEGLAFQGALFFHKDEYFILNKSKHFSSTT